MLDETIKQIVLKFKVDDQANFGEINKQFSKLNESFGKAIPTREANEFLRISEKIGGEFQKVAQNMTNMRMTQLKGDLKDVTQQLTDLQGKLRDTNQQLKSAVFSGDRSAYETAYAQQNTLMGQISALGGQQQSLMDSTRKPTSRGLGKAVMAGQMLSAAGTVAGTYEDVQGFKQQAIIENRLSRMESYAADMRRNQEIMYSGDIVRAISYSKNQSLAQQMAIADIAGGRRQLEGQVIQQYSGIPSSGLGSGLTGAATGVGGGHVGMAVGATTGILSGMSGQIGAASRSSFELSQFDIGKRALAMQKQREYQERLMETDPNLYLDRSIMRKAGTYGRTISDLGIGESQFFNLRKYGQEAGLGGEESVGAFRSLQGTYGDIGAKTATRRGGLMYSSGIGAGTLQDRARLAAALAGAGRGDVDTAMQYIGSDFADTGMQKLSERLQAQKLESSVVPLSNMGNRSRIAGAGESIQRSGATGFESIQGLQRGIQMADSISPSGTLEDQVMRNSIRGGVLGAGLTGGMAVSAEKYISQLSIQEINNLPNNKKILSMLGISKDQARAIAISARQAKKDIFKFKGADDELINKAMRGDTTSMARLAFIDSGGSKERFESFVGAGSAMISDLGGNNKFRGGQRVGTVGENRFLEFEKAGKRGEKALDEDMRARMDSGELTPEQAHKAMGQRLSSRKQDASVYKELIGDERQGFSKDVSNPIEGVADDFKRSLSSMTEALQSAASVIKASFGSAGKTVR